MRISKCDKCGKVDYEVRCKRNFFTYYEVGAMPLEIWEDKGPVVDLCDDCYKDFVTWFGGEKKADEFLRLKKGGKK